MQHMPAPAPDESRLQTTRTREPWADASHDDPASSLEDLTKGVPTVSAAGSRGDMYDDLSDDQVFDLPLPGFQIHLPDNEGDVSIIEH